MKPSPPPCCLTLTLTHHAVSLRPRTPALSMKQSHHISGSPVVHKETVQQVPWEGEK